MAVKRRQFCMDSLGVSRGPWNGPPAIPDEWRQHVQLTSLGLPTGLSLKKSGNAASSSALSQSRRASYSIFRGSLKALSSQSRSAASLGSHKSQARASGGPLDRCPPSVPAGIRPRSGPHRTGNRQAHAPDEKFRSPITRNPEYGACSAIFERATSEEGANDLPDPGWFLASGGSLFRKMRGMVSALHLAPKLRGCGGWPPQADRFRSWTASACRTGRGDRPDRPEGRDPCRTPCRGCGRGYNAAR